MKIIKFLLFASLFYLISCSATKETSEESTSTEQQSVYVFDDVSSTDATSTAAEEVTPTEVSKDTKPASEIESKDSTYTFDFESKEETSTTFQLFIVQLGAFSTLEKAETFVSNTKDKSNYELNIHYSDKVKLHVVQLTPFRTREKADEVRDELRKIKEFNGAFIVPNNK